MRASSVRPSQLQQQQQPELRTPLAWRHRDMSFNGNGSVHNLRPSSPSVTSTSSDDREEVPMVRHPPRTSRPSSRNGAGSRLGERPPSVGHSHHHPHHHHHHAAAPALPGAGDHFHYGYRSGTLRSTRSVPALALATWDGEPCPVHGHGPPVSPLPPPLYAAPSQLSTLRKYGSMYDVRSGHPYASSLPPPAPPVMMSPQPALEKKSFHGSMQMLGSGPPSPFGPPPGPHLFPPMMRPPRPLVFPAMAEPLPMRDPFKMRTPPPHPGMVAKADDTYSVDEVCCKGHLIVLWIILGVVTVGVILGIVLGVTIN